MERVHLDFIGPLPRTERGNEHILMMVDQFTKWVECILLFSNETPHRCHQCTIASLYLSVRRVTIRGSSRFMYVKG
jgi:hypothetical protein